MIATAKLLKAANEMEEIFDLIEGMDEVAMKEFVRQSTEEHDCPDGNKCKHLGRIQYLAYIIDDWQKRFSNSPTDLLTPE